MIIIFLFIKLKMLKFIICFSFLLNLYNCEKKEESMTFEVNPNLGKEKEFNVNSGQEFIIKLYSRYTSWVLLNKNEKDSVTFIKTDYIEEYEEKDKKDREKRRGYILYYFKANSITKEPKLLKFTDTQTYLKESNPTPKFIIKINVN